MRGAKHPALLLLVAAVRLLTLLLTVELSGLSHATLDVCSSLALCSHEASDCDDEEAGHECPPGCPSCHCWHAGAPTVQLAIEWAPPLVTTQSAEAGFTPAEDATVTVADKSSLYRPPRARGIS
jgi:hypothetical protein